jgi:hypothetical protein
MTSIEILAELSQRAAEFDFPILDNTYWDLIAGRVRAFRSGEDTALVFEFLIFHTQAQAFLLNVHAYGSLVHSPRADRGGLSYISELPESPLWDQDGEWLRDLASRTVSVNGARVTVIERNPDSSASASGDIVHLGHGDAIDERAFGRAVARELGLTRSMPDECIFTLLPQLSDAPEIVRLSNWDHPDILGGQQPSDSVALSELAKLLARETERVEYDHALDNVEWRAWKS